MSEIEKIKRYIELTKIRNPIRYDMDITEGLELSKQAYDSTDMPLEIIVLAFEYGRAKGYRAAKAEEQRP